MPWVQIVDDGVGATPQAYTDTQGHSTSMTVAASGATPTYNAGLNNSWVVGDNTPISSEFHIHSFTEPVHVLRIDINFLDNGDFANFAYADESGNVIQINLSQWVANGDAVLTLGAGHANTN